MQSVEPVVARRREAPLDIVCEAMPAFDPSNIENVRRAFMTAMPCPLQQAWLDEPEAGLAPAVVRMGWRGSALLAFAQLTDADIFNGATKLNQRTWEMGDVLEMFLRPAKMESYVEFHVTPNNQRLQLHYASGLAADGIRKTGAWESALVRGKAFDSVTWLSKGMWEVYAEIPALAVCGANVPLDNTQWRFSFARYDFTRGIKVPVISSTSPHDRPDFHRQHEWGVMTFKTKV